MSGSTTGPDLRYRRSNVSSVNATTRPLGYNGYAHAQHPHQHQLYSAGLRGHIQKRRARKPFPSTLLPHDLQRIARSTEERYSAPELQAAGTLYCRFDDEAPKRLELAWLIHHDIPTPPPLPLPSTGAPKSKERAAAHSKAVVRARVNSFAEVASRLGATRALLFDQVPGTPFTLLQYLFVHGDIVRDKTFFISAFNILSHGIHAYLKRESQRPTYSTWCPDSKYSLCELAVDCIQRSGNANKAVTVNLLHVLLKIGVPADAPGCVALPLAVMLGEPTATKLLLLYGADTRLLPLHGVMPLPKIVDEAPTEMLASANSNMWLTNEQRMRELARNEIREFLSEGWLQKHWGALKRPAPILG